MYSEDIYDEKNPYIPYSMFLFFPHNPDDLYRGDGQTFKRYIFEGDELQNMSDFQKQHERKFEAYIEQKKHKLPMDVINNPFWTRTWKYRWLVSLQFDAKRTVKEMVRYTQYLKTNRFDITPKAERLLKEGIIYMSGRDSSFRPIIVFDIAKMLHLNITGQELIEAQKFFIQFLLKNIMLPGQAETLVAVVDCGFKNIFSMLSIVKDTISFLSTTFRCRMKSAYLIKIPPSASFLWGIVKNFISADARKRMFIVDGQTVGPLFKSTHPSQIQKKFSGTQENITQFWPIKKVCQLSPRQYLCEGQEPKLISIQKYQQKYKQGKLKNYRVCEKLLDEDLLTNKQDQFVTEEPPLADTHKEQIFDPTIVFPAQKYPTQPEQVDFENFDWFSLKEIEKTQINN